MGKFWPTAAGGELMVAYTHIHTHTHTHTHTYIHTSIRAYISMQ